MDFFASQELARRNTRKLVFLLIITVIALISAIYGLALLVFGGLGRSAQFAKEFGIPTFFSTENGMLVAGISVLVIFVVLIGSWMKTSELRKGGATVANMLGGRRLLPNTTNLSERRILNIVEEMSLASGVPVPPVYVLDNEPGINAFAAGHTIDDAVIGINRGTLEKLNRDELQGVVAHEFSHILNGDMRMSLRMIGLLFGIQGIALIGSQLMRLASHMTSRTRSSRDKGGNAALAFLIFGLGLLAIGSIGLFFARLIKASVSRQREYLADASAVQFTRIPDGISGALKMIGANSQSSTVKAPDAESISHMFFANMFGSNMQSYFATHPPLVPRIQRLDPRFDGRFADYQQARPSATVQDSKAEEREHQRRLDVAKQFGLGMGGMGGTGMGGMGMGEMGVGLPAIGSAASTLHANAAEIIASVGAPGNDDVVYTQFLVDHVPEKFLEDCREVFSARCIVFASLLDTDSSLRQQQLLLLSQREEQATADETIYQARVLESIPIHFRLPIFEILQGTLTGLSPEQFLKFQETLRKLVTADKEIDLFEFFLLQHLLVHLRRALGLGIKNKVKYEKLGMLTHQVELVLSIVAKQGHATDAEAAAALTSANAKLSGLSRTISFTGGAWNFNALTEAIREMSHWSFNAKKEFLTALATMIIHDQTITHIEAELFRAIAESLDCPVPPIMADRSTNASTIVAQASSP